MYIYNYIYIIWLDIIIQEINTICYHYSSKMLIFYIYLGVAKPFTTARLISIFIHLHQTWARIYDIYALMATQKIPKSIPIRIKIIQNPSFCQVKFVVFILQWITIRLGGTNQNAGRLLLGVKRGWRSLCGKSWGSDLIWNPFGSWTYLMICGKQMPSFSWFLFIFVWEDFEESARDASESTLGSHTCLNHGIAPENHGIPLQNLPQV